MKALFRGFVVLCFFCVLVKVVYSQEKSAIGTIAEFSGAVERRGEGVQTPETVTTQTRDLALYQNDTLTTGKDGTTKIVMSDGTVLTLEPNTTVSLKKTESGITVELKTGNLRMDCKSDLFTLSTAHHTFTGAGATLKVAVSQENEVTVFCIDGQPTVSDKNGFQILPKEGQVFTVKYDKDNNEFRVQADEHNEENLLCKAKEAQYNLPPGGTLRVDSSLNVRTKDGILVEKPPLVVKLPKIEEPKDKAFKDAGDVYQLPVVSPKKP
jgi:hypothetical protein